jgi:hypothetical protein
VEARPSTNARSQTEFSYNKCPKSTMKKKKFKMSAAKCGGVYKAESLQPGSCDWPVKRGASSCSSEWLSLAPRARPGNVKPAAAASVGQRRELQRPLRPPPAGDTHLPPISAPYPPSRRHHVEADIGPLGLAGWQAPGQRGRPGLFSDSSETGRGRAHNRCALLLPAACLPIGLLRAMLTAARWKEGFDRG